MDGNVLCRYEILKQLLEVLTRYFKMQIAEQTFINVITFHDLLNCSSCTKNEVCVAEIMN